MAYLNFSFKYLFNLFLKFLSNLGVITLLFFFVNINEVFSEEGSKKIEISFYNLKIGHFNFNYKISNSDYVINSSGKLRNFIFFSNLSIFSGSIGKITETGNLLPTQSSINYNLNKKKLYKSKILFKNDKIIDFISSGQPNFLKTNFNPIGVKNSIDPSTTLLFFLRKKNINEICNEKISVIDGHRLVHIFFEEKKILSNNEINCKGVLTKSKGFRESFFFKKSTSFFIFYKKNKDNKYHVEDLSFKTMLGPVKVKISG